LLLLLALTPLAVRSGELRHAEVRHRDGVYFVHIDAEIAADGNKVHTIVTDFEHLERLSAVLDEASVDPAEPRRLHLRGHTCILIYCFQVMAVGEVDVHNRELITATIIPALSDFKYGAFTWQLLARHRGACSVHIAGRVEPAFWIPPVIGPYLMRRKIIREAGKVIVRIEDLAAHE